MTTSDYRIFRLMCLKGAKVCSFVKNKIQQHEKINKNKRKKKKKSEIFNTLF